MATPKSHEVSPLRQSQLSDPTLLPKTKLHWRKVANIPAGMGRPQVLIVGERVYVGGGRTFIIDNSYLVFQYDPASDEWTTLPPCLASGIGLGQLSGELLTLGGWTHNGVISKRVYRYKPESQKWEEFLKPMPTARAGLTVISAQSALIACGGVTYVSDDKFRGDCTAVEVYTTETSQWHTTDPLPVPCWLMSSATIADTAYLLGGVTTDQKPTSTVLYAPVASLIQRATPRPQQSASAARPDSISSAWKTLRDTPLVASAAASLGGILLAIGGCDHDDQDKTLPAVHVYSPATSAWVRVGSGDLPEPRYFCTAVELSANRVLVIEGQNENMDVMNTVYIGSFTMGV